MAILRLRVRRSIHRAVMKQGHDLLSLLYNFMDACLMKFCVDELIICRVQVHGIKKEASTRAGG